MENYEKYIKRKKDLEEIQNDMFKQLIKKFKQLEKYAKTKEYKDLNIGGICITYFDNIKLPYEIYYNEEWIAEFNMNTLIDFDSDLNKNEIIDILYEPIMDEDLISKLEAENLGIM